jgi:hypothetical protein
MIILKILARNIFFYGEDSPLYQQITSLTFHEIMDKGRGKNKLSQMAMNFASAFEAR